MNALTELEEGLRIALDSILQNKLRAILTTLGIVIGVGTVSLMGSAISGLNTAFHESISQLGSDVYFVQKFTWGDPDAWEKMRNRRDITLRDARRVRRELTLARGVSFEAQSMQAVRYRNRSADSVWTVGNNEESSLVRGLIIHEGRFFTGPEVDGARPVCVLGAELRENLFPDESPLGKKIRVGGRKYEVVGSIEKMGQFLFGNLDNQVIVPITRFVTDFAWRPDVMIMVKVINQEAMQDARIELRGILRKVRKLDPGEEDDFGINQQEQIVAVFNRVGGTIAAGGLVITGLSLFVGGIGIMNIMFVSVTERTSEIGLRKALGARRRTILVQFLIEAAALCLVGGAIGLGLAMPVTLLLRQYFPATLSWPVVLAAVAISILTGLVSGFLPAFRASRMAPVEALRHE